MKKKHVSKSTKDAKTSGRGSARGSSDEDNQYSDSDASEHSSDEKVQEKRQSDNAELPGIFLFNGSRVLSNSKVGQIPSLR